MHCEKSCGFGIEDVGRETFIDWNGPPILFSDDLCTKTLNGISKGTKWHFITVANTSDSEVTKRLKDEKLKLHFSEPYMNNKSMFVLVFIFDVFSS
jgi:hypothetical protein